MVSVEGYDIIGDVHGYADKLEGLLRELGYQKQHDVFRHPARQAIFVGDLIDRGPQQIETITIVRDMVDDGAAQIVMGNHEFNAISYRTPDPTRPDDFMRSHAGAKGGDHFAQHEAFLAQISDDRLRAECVQWFTTLPMWLELPGIRIVHACWHQESIEALKLRLGNTSTIDDQFIIEANTKGTAAYTAVETVLKGPEVDLADPQLALDPVPSFRDKEGIRRTSARIRWWDTSATTLRDIALIPDTATDLEGFPLPNRTIDAADKYRYLDATPVVFGHYWWNGTPRVASNRTACVDYSVGKGGPMVAYRRSGELELRSDHFVSFDEVGR